MTDEEQEYVQHHRVRPVLMRCVLTVKNDEFRRQSTCTFVRKGAFRSMRRARRPYGDNIGCPDDVVTWVQHGALHHGVKGTLMGAGAKNADLQSKRIERVLVFEAPKPPPGVAPGALFRAKGVAYVTRDAG